jgi:hypothetical protein
MGTPNGKDSSLHIDYHNHLLPIEGYENIPLIPLEFAVEPLMTLLPSIQTYVSIAKEKCSNPADGLTCDQSASIMLCTMRWQPLDQCLSFVLNTILRSTDRQKLKPWFSYLKILLISLNRLPSIHRFIYRGIQYDVSEQYSKDQTIIWWDFSLCTKSIDQLYSNKYFNKKNVRTIFTIECSSSKDISKHSFDSSTNLIVLLPATQLKVIQCVRQKSNLYWIQLKEVESPFTLLKSVSIDSEVSYASEIPIFIPSFWNYKSSIPNDDKHKRNLISKYPSNSPIQLRYDQLSNDDMKMIVQQAIIEKQCTELWLNNARINSQGALILSNELLNNSTLKKLYLNDNSIHDRGVHYLSQVLSINNITLKELYLARNGITSKGAQYLADMLNTNRTLTILSLYGNRIDDEGIKYLTHVLRYYNTNLEYLYLSGNNLMTDLSVDYFIDMFKQNQTLRKVHLFNCNLSDNGKTKLREMIQTKNYLILNI